MEDEVDSPVGVLEDYFFKSSESETSSSKEPGTTDSDKSKSGSRWHAFLQLLRVKSKKPVATLYPPIGVLKLSRRLSSGMRMIDADSSLHRSPWKIFTHHEIQIATNFFAQGMLHGLHVVVTDVYFISFLQ